MTDNIFGQRFYGHRDAAWHSKGQVSQEPITAEEALQRIGGVYIEKRPHFVTLNGQQEHVGYDLVRSATPDDASERMFGYATEQYHILQPIDFATLFDQNVRQPVETLGFLGKGERMFLTWKLPSFDVVTGDSIDLYGFIPAGFDGKMGCSINVVSVRVVCKNTWMAAISEAQNSKDANKGVIWSGRHTSPNLVEDLGAWMEHVQERAEYQTDLIKAFFGKLTDIPLGLNDASNIVYDVYRDPAPVGDIPNKLRERKETDRQAKVDSISKIRDGILYTFDGHGTKIDATAWGLFNATTEFLNYGLASKKDTAESVLVGNRHEAMNKMANYLMKI